MLVIVWQNVEMTDELQVMFQPQNWRPNNFGSEPLICLNHRAISHLLVGNRGEYWGPNSFLVKTGHTTAAIKLEGMSGARLVISLSVSLGLHLSCLLLESQNERQALVRVLRVSPNWTPRAKVWVNVGWWMAIGGDKEHISQARQIKEWQCGWLFKVFFLNLFLSFSLFIFVYISSLLFGQLIKSTNLIRACLKRSSGASCFSLECGLETIQLRGWSRDLSFCHCFSSHLSSLLLDSC